jgi:hypothetical protein
MPGLVPGIHVFTTSQQERRGWPGRSPAMTKARIVFKRHHALAQIFDLISKSQENVRYVKSGYAFAISRREAPESCMNRSPL